MILNTLAGLLVIGVALGLWYICETSVYGERFVAILLLIAIAYGIGGIVRAAL